MLVETLNAEPKQLDWLVSRIKYRLSLEYEDKIFVKQPSGEDILFAPTIDPAVGMPIIEEILLYGAKIESVDVGYRKSMPIFKVTMHINDHLVCARGDTVLIAAMRFFAYKNLGEKVFIPMSSIDA